MTPEDAVLRAAEAALADGDVVTDPDVMATYSVDRSTGSPVGEPFAVAFPRTTDQVSAILTAAHQHRVPVVPRGAGSGLSGGANAIDGSIVVCVERMRELHTVDAGNGFVETGPGVLNQELRENRTRTDGLPRRPAQASAGVVTAGRVSVSSAASGREADAWALRHGRNPTR
jgi:glycolate oxidase